MATQVAPRSNGGWFSEGGALKAAGAAAIAGAVVGIISNLLHPRPGEYGDHEAFLSMVRDSDIWVLDHYLIGWSIALGLVALVALAGYMTDSPTWSRVARAMATGSATVGFLTAMIDGAALKHAADANAAWAPALYEVSDSLFMGLTASLFGITPLVYGLVQLAGRRFPDWYGWLAVAGGVLGIITATIEYLSGTTAFTVNVLFTAASALTTVWLLVSGMHLWRGGAAPARVPAAATS